jgi:hypothetical protein
MGQRNAPITPGVKVKHFGYRVELLLRHIERIEGFSHIILQKGIFYRHAGGFS